MHQSSNYSGFRYKTKSLLILTIICAVVAAYYSKFGVSVILFIVGAIELYLRIRIDWLANDRINKSALQESIDATTNLDRNDQ
jgi:hypothetical protein